MTRLGITAVFPVAPIVLATALACAAALPAADATIDLKAFQSLCVPASPDEAERSMADVLRRGLHDLYGIEVTVTNGPPQPGQPAIVLGRSLALGTGTIAGEELEAVKHDGYVIKGSGGRIALAGYAPQGTIYATYAFLRHAGLKLYPWRNFDAVEARRPAPGGTLEAFSIASKPFFARRDLLGYLDRGRWGASLTEYSLGDFRAIQDHEYFKGKGWLGADHTAPYLVPMAKYYDAHPEYFAMHDGKRIAKDTQNARVALCLSNPAVHQIAAQRALEWMAGQPQRRFFHITDGDTRECGCPACTALDPDPGSCTDRNLRWVNAVAREVGKRYPDNVVMALAYMNTVRPPREVKPEPNVVVLYCPWYWTSRTTSAVGWASPLNLTAMREFTAWAMRFPNQMGLYDYPDAWVQGQAERIKFLAKRGVRVFYSCGGHGDLYQWVNARLLWDPFLNTEELIEEFLGPYYGPAAAPMGDYLRLQQRTIERQMAHTRDPFRDERFLRSAADLLDRAEQAAAPADERTRARILADVVQGRLLLLEQTHPDSAAAELRRTWADYRGRLEHYVKLSEQVAALCERLGNRFAAGTHRSGLQESLQSLGFMEAPGKSPAEPAAQGEALASRVMAAFDDQMRKSGATSAAAGPPKVCRFDQPDEAGRWLSDASRPELIVPPRVALIEAQGGQRLAGIAVEAPFTRLPVISHGKRTIHAGRFYAERAFDPPLDVGSRPFLDVSIYASADVPATFYLNDLHSDVDLHAGEQIVRIDWRNFDRSGRFSYAEWDKALRRISLDLWPQDNYAPYPKARDVEVLVLGMVAGDRPPVPARLPHEGRAIWLSQFRPNLPRGVALPRSLYDQYLQRQHFRHVGLDYGSRWISERFRTFTEHRAASPIFAILTARDAPPEERRAAAIVQDCLERMFGVRLPVRDAAASPDQGNVFLVGREPCLAAGRISEEELRYVGPGGFVINAHQGRIAVAGADEEGTLQGVMRYLEDHGVKYFEPQRIKVPDLRGDLLHELYLADWPYFRGGPSATACIPEGFKPLDSSDSTPRAAAGREEIVSANALAEAIKDLARAGKQETPPPVAEQAARSPLVRYTAARLLWDPTADATRLIREFLE